MKHTTNTTPICNPLKMLGGLVFVVLSLAQAVSVSAQGTVTFDHPWATSGMGQFSLYYDSSGISIRVNPYPPQPHDNVTRVGATAPTGYPQNGTPYAAFVNRLGFPQFVVFALTNAASLGLPFTDGDSFGLVCVDLADPAAPSLSPVAITFTGFKTDGSMVNQTFTVGGGGSSSFQTFQFNSDFALGLTRVEIPSPAWAMDNLVWIPEPNTAALILVGVLVIIARRTVR